MAEAWSPPTTARAMNPANNAPASIPDTATLAPNVNDGQNPVSVDNHGDHPAHAGGAGAGGRLDGDDDDLLLPPAPPPPPAEHGPLPDDDEMFREFSEAIAADLPLLMYGSGDARPSRVDPETVRVLADATACYVAELVAAAVEAHDAGGDRGGRSSILPPPKRRRRARPRTTTTTTALSVWDDDHDLLPPPPTSTTTNREGDGKNVDDRRAQENDDGLDDWQGVAGVDFFARHRYDNRVRRPPRGLTMTTQSFLFPVCHDAELYGRAKRIIAARRKILPVLMDPVLVDAMKEECGVSGRGAANVSVLSRPADATDEVVPEWPGAESILSLLN